MKELELEIRKVYIKRAAKTTTNKHEKKCLRHKIQEMRTETYNNNIIIIYSLKTTIIMYISMLCTS